ncbi:MAG: hypothetical protein ACI9KE_005640, partial [Polyangiales bacterium]
TMALASAVPVNCLRRANDVFLERFRAEQPVAFAEAVASLSLPVPWLIRHGTWSELADSAESLLLAPDYDRWSSSAAEILAEAPDAATRMDALVQNGRLEWHADIQVRNHRSVCLPIAPDLLERARAHGMAKNHVPMEVVHAACAHPDTLVQAHGAQALFERLGKEAPIEFLETALASGGLPRTVALRVSAALGEEDAIRELIERADVGEELLVHTEAFRSLHLAGVPTSRFLPQVLAGLNRLDSTEEAAPVASEAAHALWKADDLNGDDIVQALADAVTKRVPWPTWLDIDAAIGSWLGDAPDATWVRRQRCFF